MRDRRRIVKGWAFRNHTDEEITAIYQYLATGDMGVLPDRYRLLDPQDD
jgi:hypothetical protein